MDFIEPWRIKLACVNFAGQVDIEGLANEIFLLNDATPPESKIPYVVTAEEFPLICAFRDGLITDALHRYIREVFNIEPQDMVLDTFGKWIKRGTELGAHIHGSSGITSIFYPFDYTSGLMVSDPRFTASRGYSRRIRDEHFDNYRVTPKAGDLWIIPSYIQHSVPTVNEDMRLSLVNECYFV